jgi:hypothetical protein
LEVSSWVHEKLSNEIFIAVVGNVVKDFIDGDQDDLTVLAVVHTVVEDLVNGNQEYLNKWFECNDSTVMTSIAMTFGEEKFDRENAMKTGNNGNPDDLFCSNFSNSPLPFSSVTFCSIEGCPFFDVTFVVFLLAFGMIVYFFLWVCA